MEVGEFRQVREQDIASLTSSDTDGPVVVDDSGMYVVSERGEELRNVPAIVSELGSAFWEDEQDCLGIRSPGDDPVSMGLDRLRRFGGSDGDLEGTKFLRLALIDLDRVEGSVDTVEVDSLSEE